MRVIQTINNITINLLSNSTGDCVSESIGFTIGTCLIIGFYREDGRSNCQRAVFGSDGVVVGERAALQCIFKCI